MSSLATLLLCGALLLADQPAGTPPANRADDSGALPAVKPRKAAEEKGSAPPAEKKDGARRAGRSTEERDDSKETAKVTVPLPPLFQEHEPAPRLLAPPPEASAPAVAAPRDSYLAGGHSIVRTLVVPLLVLCAAAWVLRSILRGD